MMNRPINKIGTSNFQLERKDEKDVFLVLVITEGSEEEPNYIEFYKDWLAKNGLLHKSISCLNKINDECGTNSHPLARYKILKSILQLKDPNYSAYSTEAWIICDRDERSFTEEQYDLLVSDCKKDNINLVVSNPAFQLWILFHFDSWIRELYFEDEKNNIDRLKFIEKRIQSCLKFLPYAHVGYSHGQMLERLFQVLCTRVDDAVKNSRNYVTNIDRLKKEDLGTNFADFIDMIRG